MDGGDYQIGKLRHRITLMRPETTNHPDTGEPIHSWTNVVLNVPAGFSETQSETESGRKNTRLSNATFVIRFRSIDTTWRIVHAGRVFEVQGAVDLDSRRRFLRVTATEVV
jgi:SPP1 family predicted phage head-tail adaptor